MSIRRLVPELVPDRTKKQLMKGGGGGGGHFFIGNQSRGTDLHLPEVLLVS